MFPRPRPIIQRSRLQSVVDGPESAVALGVRWTQTIMAIWADLRVAHSSTDSLTTGPR